MATLKKKTNYVPKRNIKSITVKRGNKTTEIDGKNLFDGAYVKKGVKFKEGGKIELIRGKNFEQLFTEIVDSLESDFGVNREVAFKKVFNTKNWDKTRKFLNEGYAPNQVAQMFYKGEFGKMKYEDGGNANCYCYEIGGL